MNITPSYKFNNISYQTYLKLLIRGWILQVSFSIYFDAVLLRGLFPRLDGLASALLWPGVPRPPARGLCSPLSSLNRGLKERWGLSILFLSDIGVAVELVILGLLIRLNSPRLRVITSSKISPSPPKDAPAPSSASCSQISIKDVNQLGD